MSYAVWWWDEDLRLFWSTSETNAKLMAERWPERIYFFYGEDYE